MASRPTASALIPLAAITLALASPRAIAQSGPMRATIHLTHDDTDSVIAIGETVTWTLAVSFQNAHAAEGGNLKLIAGANLGVASDMVFTETNGGTNGGQAEGPHLPFVNWTNSLLLDAFGHPADRTNPFTVGTFQFTASAPGTFTYDILKGWSSAPFLTLANSPLDRTDFAMGEPDLEIDSLTILPPPGSAALLTLGLAVSSRKARQQR